MELERQGIYSFEDYIEKAVIFISMEYHILNLDEIYDMPYKFFKNILEGITERNEKINRELKR